MNFSKNLTQFYINFSRQEHQIHDLKVSFNAWDSQVSSYTHYNFSFTVPLKQRFLFLIATFSWWFINQYSSLEQM